jgi:hypothetical protein
MQDFRFSRRGVWRQPSAILRRLVSQLTDVSEVLTAFIIPDEHIWNARQLQRDYAAQYLHTRRCQNLKSHLVGLSVCGEAILRRDRTFEALRMKKAKWLCCLASLIALMEEEVSTSGTSFDFFNRDSQPMGRDPPASQDVCSSGSRFL